MANSLVNQKNNSQEMKYMVGADEIKLTPNTVRNYLVSGNKEKVSIEEIVVFMNLCKYQGLNPWVKECYLIKYGNEPATMVVSKEAFQKRAEGNPKYDGCVSGIIVLTADNTVEHRVGTFSLANEKLVGGWAEVFRKDRSHSTRVEVSFDEYAGRKSDGSLNSQWSKKPATMIRKVALAQALRETFPAALGGLFTAEEQDEAVPVMDVTVNDIEVVPAEAPQVVEQVEEPVEVSVEEDVQMSLFG